MICSVEQFLFNWVRLKKLILMILKSSRRNEVCKQQELKKSIKEINKIIEKVI
jgi:hypothetical protein